ncbi:hypothetical protein M3Y97_00663100 [Aphelenchoides bicaudatus]|nr:hypothetical protein M3Y97_00663100 [Aphelenchoides bicaudatus]
MSPLGSIAKYLLNDLLKKQNKTESKNWKETVEKMRQSSALMRNKENEEFDEKMAPIAMIQKLGRIGTDGKNQVDIESFLHDKQQMKKQMMKMPRKEGGPVDKIFKLVRQGLKLGYAMSGKNSTDFDDKNTRVLSPKFLSISPEMRNETDEIDFLSPNLFSLHDKGDGLEKLTSLPQLLSGFTTKEQDMWMNYIMEAAGVNEEAEKMEHDLSNNKTAETIDLLKAYKKEGFTKDGTPLYFTRENITDDLGGSELKQKADHFEQLSRMYTKEQLKQMNQTGFTFMTRKQVTFIYGPTSPYNDTERLEFFGRLNETKMKTELHEEVHRMAERRSFSIRQRDIILSPVTFTPIILAPALLSQAAILSPIIFSPGKSILHNLQRPWMFVPVIASPRILSPLVLSPFMFSPLILSPVALHPAILSPGMFNPLVLTPFVLTPFILSPQLFTPLILSPFALSPLILSPLAGSPLILNPFILSPGVLSPGYLGGIILSPYALSPFILSPVMAFVVLLSPSWLS